MEIVQYCQTDTRYPTNAPHIILRKKESRVMPQWHSFTNGCPGEYYHTADVPAITNAWKEYERTRKDASAPNEKNLSYTV